MLPVSALKSLLSPERARLLASADSPIFPDAEVTVGWGGIPKSSVSDCLTALRTKTWATNFDKGDASYTVLDPVVGMVPLAKGLWRAAIGTLKVLDDVKQESVEPRYSIQLTLRKGYATALSMDEARIMEPGRYTLRQSVDIMWVNLAGNVCGLAASVSASLSPLAVGGESLAGSWVRKFSNGWRVKDGSGVVMARFAVEPDSITIPESADALSVGQRIIGRYDTRAAAAAALAAVVQTSGKKLTGSVEQSEEGFIAVINDDTAQELTAAATTTETTASQTITTATDRNVATGATAPTPPSAAAPVDGQVTVVRREKTQYPAISNVSTEKRVAVKQASAVSVATTSATSTEASATDRNAATGDAAPTPPSAPSPITGVIVTERTEKSPEFPGIVNKTLEKRTAVELLAAQTSKQTTATEKVSTATDRHVDAGNTPPTPPTPDAAVDGQVTLVREEKTDFPGKSVISTEKRVAVKLAGAESVATTDATSTLASITDRNAATADTAPTPPTPPSPSTGKVVTVRTRKSADYTGIVDKTVEERTAVQLLAAQTSKQTQAGETSVYAMDRNVPAGNTPPTPPSADAPVSGQIISVVEEKTEYPGKSVVHKTVRTAVKVDSGWVQTPAQYGYYVKTRVIENATLTEINTAIAEITGVYVGHVRISPTAFPGLFTAHLTQTADLGGSAPAPASWSNFSKTWTGFKSYTVGSKAYKVAVSCGIIQTNDKDAVATFFTDAGTGGPHHNTRFESINGGKHFRGTYMDITAAPTEIT